MTKDNDNERLGIPNDKPSVRCAPTSYLCIANYIKRIKEVQRTISFADSKYR
jgi:hypothetical protein